jgi:hypothetical protein
MIRCVRLWTGDDRNSHFEEGVIDLEPRRGAEKRNERTVRSAIGVLEKCFPNELTASGWLPRLKEIIPSYGVSLMDDADLLRRVRADTAAALKIENI